MTGKPENRPLILTHQSRGEHFLGGLVCPGRELLVSFKLLAIPTGSWIQPGDRKARYGPTAQRYWLKLGG